MQQTVNNGFMLWIFSPTAASDISCARGVSGSVQRGREDKREEREINKSEENRSINISAAAPFTDFSRSHKRWRESTREREGLIKCKKDREREGGRESRGNCVPVLILSEKERWRVKERDGEWG